MCRPLNSSDVQQQRGFSLVEMLISLALLILLSLITISGMMMHARMAKSNLVQQQIAEASRRFIDAVQVSALDSTVIRIDAGPSGPATVLTLGKPDPDVPGQVIYKQYAYLDLDSNPQTIGDNRLVERDTDTPMATTGKELTAICSPVAGSTVFSKVSGTARPLYQINLRVGDRTSPPSPEDNAQTGPGYQSFLISANISQL